MRIITFARIREYIKDHPDADIPLRNWYKTTKSSDWSNFTEIKETFNSVDYVGNDRYVFNIKGNKYRLIVKIVFISKTIYIKFIGTHADYDEIDSTNIDY